MANINHSYHFSISVTVLKFYTWHVDSNHFPIFSWWLDASPLTIKSQSRNECFSRSSMKLLQLSENREICSQLWKLQTPWKWEGTGPVSVCVCWKGGCTCWNYCLAGSEFIEDQNSWLVVVDRGSEIKFESCRLRSTGDFFFFLAVVERIESQCPALHYVTIRWRNSLTCWDFCSFLQRVTVNYTIDFTFMPV